MFDGSVKINASGNECENIKSENTFNNLVNETFIYVERNKKISMSNISVL